MRTLPVAFSLLAALLLSACQTTSGLDRNSPYFQYPANMRLALLHALEVPPASATVRLQFGRVVPRNGVEETEPYCILELDTVRDAPQRVAPENFFVTGVQRRVASIAALPAAPGLRKVSTDRDGGPSHLYYITEFRLRAIAQPQVRSLTCMSNQMAPGIAIMRHLTLKEIRQALGDYFSLDLPT